MDSGGMIEHYVHLTDQLKYEREELKAKLKAVCAELEGLQNKVNNSDPFSDLREAVQKCLDAGVSEITICAVASEVLERKQSDQIEKGNNL